ncbi:MAG TPA: ComEC/Rec2 family competence protein [Prolixibacteraceae bacterium]
MSRIGSQLASAPFIRLLFPLCIGVCFPFKLDWILPFYEAVCILLILIILLTFRKIDFYRQHLWGVLLLLTIFFFGVFRTADQIRIYPKLPDQQYFALLDDYPGEKEKSCMVMAQLVGVDQEILIYLPKTIEAKSGIPGDILSFNGQPELIKNDGNPFEFDYQGYLHNRKIGYRIFLKEGSFNLVKGISRQNIFHKALILRAKLMEYLDRTGIESNNVHLIGSISFGARDEVDKEVIQSFTNTGVIHVLAVSGMNVGLIFVILNLIFGFLKYGKAGNVLYTLIILMGIWTYTLITGMSASILRAALMFSFLILGKLFNRDSNIFNSLAVSAFFLIAWDPAIIRDVGFQLSYAAVLSIVVIHPLIVKQLYFKNWLLREVWILISVTCSAQLGTIPFTLLYFHQFPVYFWLANLVVIPLVSVILYLSFLVVFLAMISVHVASLVAIFLDWSVKIVLIMVKIVENMPHAVLRGLYPTLFQITVVFAMTGFFLVLLRTKKAVYLYGVVMILCLFVCSIGLDSYRQMSRAEIIFFNIQGTRALALTSGREAIILYDKCEKAQVKLGYYMKPYFGERSISKFEMFQLSDSLRINKQDLRVEGDFIFFKGIRLFIEPLVEKRTGSIATSLLTDAVWVRNQKSANMGKASPYETRFILFRPQDNSGREVAQGRGNNWIEMNRSVQMIIQPVSVRSNDVNVCRYFN